MSERYYDGDSNSSVNQRIKEQLVQQHVYACVTMMVEYILRQGESDREAPFSTGDVTNYYSYPEYYGKHAQFPGGTEAERDKEVERLEELAEGARPEDPTSDENDDLIAEIENDIEELKNLAEEPQEVYEWWLVSDFLCRKLKDMGEVVLYDEGIWGRCGTGQAILLDGTMSRIAADMGILDGQEHSWANMR